MPFCNQQFINFGTITVNAMHISHFTKDQDYYYIHMTNKDEIKLVKGTAPYTNFMNWLAYIDHQCIRTKYSESLI